MKIGQVLRATEEEDEYDGALVRIVRPSETSDEWYVEILTGPKKGHPAEGPWSPTCMIKLSPLEELALALEAE